MTRSTPDPWLVLAATGSLGYSCLAYATIGSIPPVGLVLIGLGLIAVRMIGMRRMPGARRWIACLAVAGVALIALLAWKPALAARAYPVAVSLSVAAVFALSLRYPPSIVERIARLSEPDLPPRGVAYTRRVTGVWVVFLVINAAISLATALWGSPGLWALWNGVLSYVAMGLLFAGEYLIRQRVRRVG